MPSLPWISCGREARRVGRHEEAAEAAVPSSGSVWAKISANFGVVAERDPLFWPLIGQPLSVFVARVFWLAASEPVSGSVRPKQPIASPRADPGQKLLLLLLACPT